MKQADTIVASKKRSALGFPATVFSVCLSLVVYNLCIFCGRLEASEHGCKPRLGDARWYPPRKSMSRVVNGNDLQNVHPPRKCLKMPDTSSASDSNMFPYVSINFATEFLKITETGAVFGRKWQKKAYQMKVCQMTAFQTKALTEFASEVSNGFRCDVRRADGRRSCDEQSANKLYEMLGDAICSNCAASKSDR